MADPYTGRCVLVPPTATPELTSGILLALRGSIKIIIKNIHFNLIWS